MAREKRQDPPDPERDARVAKTRRRGPPKRVYVLYDWSQEVVGLRLQVRAFTTRKEAEEESAHENGVMGGGEVIAVFVPEIAAPKKKAGQA